MLKNITILILFLILIFLVLVFVQDRDNKGELNEENTPTEEGADRSDNSSKEDEESDEEERVHEERPIKEDPQDLPSVSIVIDDLGNNLTTDMSIADIDSELTLAVLPFREHTLEVAKFFSGKREMILHLPLEPMSESDVEDRMMKAHMTDDEIVKFLDKSLEELRPYVSGVNNHKGSLFTSDREAMSVLLKAVKREDLFFVDSFTIGESKGYLLAQEMDIKTGVRDVFLDNSRDPEDIRDKLFETVRSAEEKGSAIAIGHSNPETISVLRKEIPELKERVKFVPVSEVLR
ncbi:MAG: divergent polysaccharide deacetylase family protein [Patescibacteria group bacterium]